MFLQGLYDSRQIMRVIVFKLPWRETAVVVTRVCKAGGGTFARGGSVARGGLSSAFLALFGGIGGLAWNLGSGTSFFRSVGPDWWQKMLRRLCSTRIMLVLVRELLAELLLAELLAELLLAGDVALDVGPRAGNLACGSAV